MIVHTTMVLCLQLALFGILLPGVNCKALPVKSCTDDQYKRILANGSIVCVDCLRCPMGLGPSVECGSTISVDTKIHCEMCRTGSFSPYNDYEQCQSCRVCSEDQVSKPCTSSSDTICEKKCISKGKYYEKSSDDCKDCTWCCGDGNDIVIDECLKKGMPAQKRCTVHRKKLCKPPITARPSSTALPAFLPPTTSTTQFTNTMSRRKLSNNKTSQQHGWHSSSVKSAPTTEWQVHIGVSVGVGVLSAACLICLLIIIYHKKCGKYCTSSDSLELIYITKADEESKLFELFKDNHLLKDTVCNKLDLHKSFAKLARDKCCKMDEDKVRKLEEPGISDPTRQVFDWMEGAEPNFLFGDFAKILKEIKRNDVLKCCVETLHKKIHVPLKPN